jgi:hypothetical protein
VKQKLANAIVKRCTLELFHARKNFLQNSKFITYIQKGENNILDCFQGSHDVCRKASSVCRYTNRSSDTHLPHARPITPSEEDKHTLQAVIDYRLDKSRLHTQAHLAKINKVESLHLRTLKVLPKTKTCKKNFSPKAHSAMHNDSVGMANSVILANIGPGHQYKRYQCP